MDAAPQTLLAALAALYPQSSKTTLRSWIKEGRVEVSGVVLKESHLPVFAHQTLKVSHKKKSIAHKIPLLFEDRDLVVIDKPAGLLSVSAAFEKEETAQAILSRHYAPRRVFAVHRLDQDTSGVMMFALNEEAAQRLKTLFESHDIERRYLAVVEGKPYPLKGTWKSYQYEDREYKVHETSDETQGRLAITHFEALASSSRYTLLELCLETGRKNQIRVHCQSAGIPVVGDKKYGASSHPVKRLCLHAHFLGFVHPITRKKLSFSSPMPSEFQRLVPSLTHFHGFGQ